MTEVLLKVNGYAVSRFDDVEVNLQLTSLANMARLTFIEKDSPDLMTAKNIITAGAAAVVYFDKEPVISGYIFEPSPDFSENGAGLNIIVTSPIARYIGQAAERGRIYYNQTVSAIIHDICPNIEVEAKKDKVLPKFVTYGFEKIENILQKLCNKTNSVIYSGAYGQLIVDERTEFASISGVIATGKNVLSIGRVETNDDAITIIGQRPLDDNISLDAAICTKISSDGSKKKFYYGDDVSPAAVRALKPWTKRIPVSIPNWFDKSGRLLQLNNWYKTTDAWHDLNQPLRLFSLTFRLNKKDGYAANLFLEC